MTTDRDWEGQATRRLERAVAAVVGRLRAMADQIEAEAKFNITQQRSSDYATYARVAQQVVHEITWGIANTNLGNVIDAAADADSARMEAGK